LQAYSVSWAFSELRFIAVNIFESAESIKEKNEPCLGKLVFLMQIGHFLAIWRHASFLVEPLGHTLKPVCQGLQGTECLPECDFQTQLFEPGIIRRHCHGMV
jgi:hypothetical protein